MAEKIRLQKYFSDCGILSRRAAEAEIAAGKVKVNGIPAPIGTVIDPDADLVEYAGKTVMPRQKPYTYLLLNKPRGIVCTAKDEKGRKNVTDLVDIKGVRLYPVGRLDMDSEGLILLTDDGELTNLLTHPRHEIPKIYQVTLKEIPTQEQLNALSAPMELDGYRLQPVQVRVLGERQLEMVLFEGRNRQIRKMCESVHLTVSRLVRVAIGKLTLDRIPVGKYRILSPGEVAYLKQHHN